MARLADTLERGSVEWLRHAGPLGWTGFVVLVVGGIGAVLYANAIDKGSQVSPVIPTAIFAVASGIFLILASLDFDLASRGAGLLGLAVGSWLLLSVLLYLRLRKVQR